ncbi:unnamed protein product [Phytomonas sp. EM1]|nr:unnamed protein product [Phytomonas sp. EM1]|eukprot:CCW60321.1 unnamed protein product [Phytomonas sp. isolate EM1]
MDSFENVSVIESKGARNTAAEGVPTKDDVDNVSNDRSELPGVVGEKQAHAINDDDIERGMQSAASRVLIDPTKDLWYNITANVKESSIEQIETNLLMVGSPGSGKTTLLRRIYSTFGNTAASALGNSAEGASKASKIKPTTALDYSYARRNERNLSQIAHFWELAQGTELAQLSEIVIMPENVHTIVVAVVVDASEEGLPLVWESATYWLQRVDRRVNEIADRMRAKGSTTPGKMLNRAKKRIGMEHPDLGRLRLSGVPTILVVNKLDSFKGDTVKMKLLSHSMRFLAHLYGAHVVFTGEHETHKWKMIMSHLLFQAPFDNKHIQFDPERGGILVTADKDTFADIGKPEELYQGGYSNLGTTGDPELDRWKALFDVVFPPERLPESRSLNDPFLRKLYDTAEGGYGEPNIDALRKQKDEELEHYKKASKMKLKDKSKQAINL